MDKKSPDKKKVIIIGGGRRGVAILETFLEDEEIEIKGIVDINPEAPGLKLAKRHGIPTGTDYVSFLKKRRKVDIIFEATNDPEMYTKLLNLKKGVELIGRTSIKLVWGIIKEREKALTLQRDLYRSAIGILSAAVERKERWFPGHPEQVAEYAVMLGSKLNLSEYQLEILKCAGILHDIGKLNISPEILLKTERLTEKEYEIIKNHPIASEKLVRSAEFIEEVMNAIRYHHERYDGKGYPVGLKGDRIPLVARILAIADSFAAMITDRPYAKAKTLSEAEEEIKIAKGKQFDPKLTDLFIEVIKEVFYKEKIGAK